MGAVDLVVQIESPPSVASALQRVGRAGHQVGETSRGRALPQAPGRPGARPRSPSQRMRTGGIEALRIPANPLDVLAQQVVAATALDDLGRRRAVRPGPPQRAVRPACRGRPTTRPSTCSAGRYPSDEFAELRPRIVWDRVTGTLTGRPGAQRLAVTSGGTIPDRGLFGVFLVGAEGPGKRVGELDEEMVYESRVGDVFALGATSWRIEDITHDRVLVTPAPGVPGRLPFWKGDTLGRPAELGAAIGAFTRELGRASHGRGGAAGPATHGLDEWAAGNLVGYLHEQLEATNVLPSDTTLLVERFRDELGDWRLVLHSPYGVPRARAVGAGDQRPAPRALRRRRPGRGLRRRHRDPDPRHRCRAARRRRRGLRARRDRGPGHRRGRRLGAVRGQVPRVRGPGAAAAPPRSRPALARCGSSGSGPRPCSRWPRSTPRSRSCSRRSASASRTSTTCPPWSR